MFNEHYYCVIMAGGLGTRFWPISRKALPKQFLKISDSDASLLRLAYDRMKEVVAEDHIIVVSLREYHDIVKAQLPELREENLLLEVYNRNTAPCICYAAKHLIKKDPQAVMVACPADHWIEKGAGFADTIRLALDYAAENRELITLGIKPTRADANFGYIQVSGGSKAIKSHQPVKVKTFTEKPSREIAQAFLKSGEFLWNSGIFIWQASLILEELDKYAPEITAVWKESDDLDKIYADSARVSIDYAVMEKTSIASVIPAHFKWADMGNWEALYDNLSVRDANGNATNSEGKHLFKDDSNNMVFCLDKHKLMAIKGLDNFLVVDTPDVLLICPRDENKVNDFLSELAMPEFEEYR